MKVRVYMAGRDYSGVPWAFFAIPDDEESCANARALTVALCGHNDIHGGSIMPESMRWLWRDWKSEK